MKFPIDCLNDKQRGDWENMHVSYIYYFSSQRYVYQCSSCSCLGIGVDYKERDCQGRFFSDTHLVLRAFICGTTLQKHSVLSWYVWNQYARLRAQEAEVEGASSNCYFSPIGSWVPSGQGRHGTRQWAYKQWQTKHGPYSPRASTLSGTQLWMNEYK